MTDGVRERAEDVAARRGRDPRFPRAGEWAVGLGVCALVFWYIAPVVMVLAVAGIVSGARRRDQRELGLSIGGLCLAGLGVLLAVVRVVSSAASSVGTTP